MTGSGNEPTAKPPSFLKNLASFYGTDLVMVAVFLLLTPMLLRHFGAVRFGAMAIADSVLGYLGLLNLGLQPSVTRFVAEAQAQGRHDRSNQLMSTAFALFTVLGGIGALVACVLAWNAEALFHLDASVAVECATFIAIKGVELAVMLPLGVYSAANYGVGNMVNMNVIRSFGGVVEVASVLVIVYLGGGLVAFSLAALANTVLGGLLQRVAMRKVLPQMQIAPRHVRRDTAKELLSYGSFYSLDAVIVLLVMKSDELVIGTSLGAASVAAYSVASKTVNATLRGVARLSQPLIPEFSAAAARGEMDEIRRRFMRLMDASLAMSAGAAIVFGLFGHTLITGWLHLAPEELPQGVIWCFALFLLTVSPISVASPYIGAVGLLPKLALIGIWEGLANLALSLILVRYLGLTGVILATVLIQGTSTTWFNPRVALRHQQVDQVKFWRRRLWLVTRQTVPTLAVALIGLALHVTSELSTTIAWTALTLVCHAAVVWYAQHHYREVAPEVTHG